MIGVNCAVLESCDSGFNETTLVQGVGVNQNLYIVLIRYRETSINRCGCRTPILVELEATDTGFDLFTQRPGLAIVAFACDTIVQREVVQRL